MKEIWYIKLLGENEYYSKKYWDDKTWSKYLNEMCKYDSREEAIEAIVKDIESERALLAGQQVEICSYIEVPYKD